MKIYSGNKFHINCYLNELKYREPLKEDCIVFTCKSNGILIPMIAKILGLSTARYWTGNDAWKYKNVWHYRWRAKIINLFFDKHYFISTGLALATGLEGTVRTITTPLMYAELMPRNENKKFTVMYYDASGSFKNRYGMDVIEKLKKVFPDFRWIGIGPGDLNQLQMYNLYLSIDLYIRPTRWDGDPFIVREALHFGVPTISTFSSDKFNIHLHPESTESWIREIKRAYSGWKYFT